MEKSHLSIEEFKEMFIHVSIRMEETKDTLTQADKAIGDGDHGIGMARGFLEVIKKLEGAHFTTIGHLLNEIGMTLLSAIGGAAGARFGTLFRGAGKNLKEKESFNSTALSMMLNDGLAAVKDRGRAKPGDKTMVDALEPAAMKSRDTKAEPLYEALKVVTEEARIGMEKTKEMVANIGKAKTLGERSIGYSDPGAISTYLILKYMTEFIETI